MGSFQSLTTKILTSFSPQNSLRSECKQEIKPNNSNKNLQQMKTEPDTTIHQNRSKNHHHVQSGASVPYYSNQSILFHPNLAILGTI